MRKECPNYINFKGKDMNTTLSDYESLNSVNGSDSEGNFTALTVLADLIGENPRKNFVEVVKEVCIWHGLKKLVFYFFIFFIYYLWVPLHFLVLFMSLTVLFQLPFSFIYNIFSKKFSVSAK